MSSPVASKPPAGAAGAKITNTEPNLSSTRTDSPSDHQSSFRIFGSQSAHPGHVAAQLWNTCGTRARRPLRSHILAAHLAMFSPQTGARHGERRVTHERYVKVMNEVRLGIVTEESRHISPHLANSSATALLLTASQNIFGLRACPMRRQHAF